MTKRPLLPQCGCMTVAKLPPQAREPRLDAHLLDLKRMSDLRHLPSRGKRDHDFAESCARRLGEVLAESNTSPAAS